MNADIITSTTFPHGTPGGFTAGCHGAHCPAVISCRDVHRRYSGDFAFRRMFDAGMTLEDILAAEDEAAAIAAAERRRRPGPRAKAATGDRRPAANRARAGDAIVVPRHKLRALHAKRFTDRQIADELGFTRRQITGARHTEGLPLNPDPNRRPVTTKPPATPGVLLSQETT